MMDPSDEYKQCIGVLRGLSLDELFSLTVEIQNETAKRPVEEMP